MQRFTSENMFNPTLNVEDFSVVAPNEVRDYIQAKYGNNNFKAQEMLIAAMNENQSVYSWCQDNFFLESGAMFNVN